MLFVLCIELLADLIRMNPNIKGIKFDDRVSKVSLFTDDATCLISDIDSTHSVFATTKAFEKYSGLKLNIEKSVFCWTMETKTKYTM